MVNIMGMIVTIEIVLMVKIVNSSCDSNDSGGNDINFADMVGTTVTGTTLKFDI